MATVSAIVNTKSRPIEVIRAIQSVLDQTYPDVDILVVVDGPEPYIEQILRNFQASLSSRSFQIIISPTNVGLAEARNLGVRSSTSRYVAFLDDDDEWLPQKIEAQVLLAETFEAQRLFVACRFTERTGTLEKIWPETLPDGNVPFSEYLFVHRGMLLPSTFLISRQLIEDVPFTRGLRHIEDIDWMLRAAAYPQTRIGVVSQMLAIYNNHSGVGRESRNFTWYAFFVWSIPHIGLFTPLAYSCFITRSVVSRARIAGATKRELLHLLSAALLLGSFNLRAVFSFFLSVVFTPEVRARGRRLISSTARNNTRINR